MAAPSAAPAAPSAAPSAAPETGPDAIIVSGAQQYCAHIVNGIYIKSPEQKNRRHVYVKAGDPQTVLWMALIPMGNKVTRKIIKTVAGWLIGPTVYKDQDDGRGYCYAGDHDIPCPTTATRPWIIPDYGSPHRNASSFAFLPAPTIKAAIATEDDVRRAQAQSARSAAKLAAVGQWIIAGVTGRNATRTNGRYTRTDEVLNNHPVWVKASDPTICLWYNLKGTWMVSRTAHKTKNRALGWFTTAEFGLPAPNQSTMPWHDWTNKDAVRPTNLHKVTVKARDIGWMPCRLKDGFIRCATMKIREMRPGDIILPRHIHAALLTIFLIGIRLEFADAAGHPRHTASKLNLPKLPTVIWWTIVELIPVAHISRLPGTPQPRFIKLQLAIAAQEERRIALTNTITQQAHRITALENALAAITPPSKPI